jgi:hypothetical protein
MEGMPLAYMQLNVLVPSCRRDRDACLPKRRHWDCPDFVEG